MSVTFNVALFFSLRWACSKRRIAADGQHISAHEMTGDEVIAFDFF